MKLRGSVLPSLSLVCTACIVTLSVLPAAVSAQDAENASPLDQEIRLFNYLMESRLFPYADFALEEMRKNFPKDTARMEVLEVGLKLRQGKTQDVEKLLGSKNLASDPKSQAILLQLGMAYDSMGRTKDAQAKFKQFLDLNKGKEITDPDVVRFFSIAGLKLGELQVLANDYKGAVTSYDMVVKTTDNPMIKRKFIVLKCGVYLQQAMTDWKNRKTHVANLKKEAELLVWKRDTYYFQAEGLMALADHYQGKSKEALAKLAEAKGGSMKEEKKLKERGLPETEMPRAVMRYAAGLIYFDLAKKAQKDGNSDEAKQLAGRSAGELKNTFLKYGSNEFAKRAGLKFDEVRSWIKQEFDIDLEKNKKEEAGSQELIIKRQLDLAKEMVRNGRKAPAEQALLEALTRYPVTKYSIPALDQLAKVYHSQGKVAEEVALADYLSELWATDPDAATVVLRIGSGFYKEQKEEQYEYVLAQFGRTFSMHPKAPSLLFQMGYMAEQKGRAADAQGFYQEVLEIYPDSGAAIDARERRASEALANNNIEEAVKVYQSILDSAPRSYKRARSQHRMSVALLRLKDPEKTLQAVQVLDELIARVDPAKNDPVYYQKKTEAERNLETYTNARFSLSGALLQAARETGDPALQDRAAVVTQAYLDDYPKGEHAPKSMYNLGRLYIQQKKTKEAQATFDKLSDRFPNTEEGKDALYALVKAALEEGQVDVAEEAVRKMVNKPDAYELDKIRRVARLMLDEEQYKAAYDAYNLIVRNPKVKKDVKILAPSQYALAKAAIGAGKEKEGMQRLDTFLTNYGKTTMAIEAGMTLTEFYLGKGDGAKAENALQRVNEILRSIRGEKAQLRQMEVKVLAGRVYQVQGDKKKALNNFINVALLKAETPEQGDIVKAAIEAGVEQAVELRDAGDAAMWEFLDELAELYIKSFPIGEKVSDMQKLRLEAIRHLN